MLYSSYTMAWAVYLCGVLVIVGSMLTLFWVFPKKLVVGLMILAATILLIPMQLETQEHWFAPAAIVFATDLLIQKGELWKPALSQLLLASLIAIITYLLILFVMHKFSSKQDYESAVEHDQSHV